MTRIRIYPGIWIKLYPPARPRPRELRAIEEAERQINERKWG
jgi:hypothetical protein